jgi:hypothetical protein
MKKDVLIKKNTCEVVLAKSIKISKDGRHQGKGQSSTLFVLLNQAHLGALGAQSDDLIECEKLIS